MKILNQEVSPSGELNPNTGSNTQPVPAQAGSYDLTDVIKSKVDSDTVGSDAEHQIM